MARHGLSVITMHGLELLSGVVGIGLGVGLETKLGLQFHLDWIVPNCALVPKRKVWSLALAWLCSVGT